VTTKKGVTVSVLTLIFAIVAVFIWLRYFSGALSAREQPSSLERWLANEVRHFAMPSKANRLKNPVAYSPEVLEEARAHWADHCASCHANNGSGDTQIGRNLYPQAPDMRSPRTQQLSDGELYYIIQNGVRLTGMPAWGSAGDGEGNQDSWKLVLFIRHLPRMTSEETEQMQKLNPRTIQEFEEEQTEQEFLNGSATPPSATKHHH
jgi:mono/diheme cytochrome c family protein